MKSMGEWLVALKAFNAEKAVVKDEYKNKEKEKLLTTGERLDRIERLLKLK